MAPFDLLGQSQEVSALKEKENKTFIEHLILCQVLSYILYMYYTI